MEKNQYKSVESEAEKRRGKENREELLNSLNTFIKLQSVIETGGKFAWTQTWQTLKENMMSTDSMKKLKNALVQFVKMTITDLVEFV